MLSLLGVLGVLVSEDQDFRTQYQALGLVDKECVRGSVYMSMCLWVGLAGACWHYWALGKRTCWSLRSLMHARARTHTHVYIFKSRINDWVFLTLYSLCSNPKKRAVLIACVCLCGDGVCGHVGMSFHTKANRAICTTTGVLWMAASPSAHLLSPTDFTSHPCW